ncbi:hypothetical protein HOV12_gp36 [Streptomyces phage Lilbooboo]|uniref:Uncharacterized protein n=1 Tax=Streptomyces phage Lilbooboo TaxID=2510571 RepID=A0A411B319_9CAUD|nr:hypothetical protein HOV12_gp36 [Streptomyces phage Lilbooboo]QAX94736.1 hypothetical protein SEA_LILBOOBOO_36 [Streptomyces phage Lilbooboo]
MQTFTLRSGHTVTTQRVAGTAQVEFTTTNPEGDVISTVRHSFSESVPLLKRLACSTR